MSAQRSSQGRKRSGGWAWRKGGPQAKRAKTLPAQVSRLQRQVALLKPETKCFQVSASSGGAFNSGSGVIQYLSVIAEGSDKSNRVGNTIRPSSVHVKGAFGGFTTTVTVNEMCYIALVLDRDSNGVVPTLSGATESIFTSVNVTSSVVQYNTNDRFKVLWEKTLTNEAMINGNGGAPYIEFNIPFKNVMTYRDTSATQTSAGRNALYLCYMSNTAANGIFFNGEAELFFSDV